MTIGMIRNTRTLDGRRFRAGLLLAAVAVTLTSTASAGDFRLLSSTDDDTVIRGGNPEPRPSFLLLAQADLPAFDDHTPASPSKSVVEGSSPSPVEPTFSAAVPTQAEALPSSSASATSGTKPDFSMLTPQRRFEIAVEASRPYRILYFSEPECIPCRKQTAELPAFVTNGWLVGEQPIAHLQTIKGGEDCSPAVRAQFEKYLVASLPTLILISNDREVARITGLKTSTDGYGRQTSSAWTPADLAKWMRANVESTRPRGSSGQAPQISGR